MKNNRTFRAIVAGVMVVGLLTGWTILVAPALVDHVEAATGRGGSIDFILRIYFSYAAGLLLLGICWFLFVNPPTDRRARWILILLAAHLVVLIAVWLFDRTEFTSEISAIRFFNAGSLVLASFLAALNASSSRSDPSVHPFAAVFWSLMALAFLAAGLDDYFNVHETIGVRSSAFALEFGLPKHLVQDSITAGYAVGAVLFVLIFRRCFGQDMLKPGQLSGWLVIAGIAVYGIAVVADTLDAVIARPFFPANPEHAMNFMEEALEFTATVIFIGAFATRTFERDRHAFERLFGVPSLLRGRRVASILLMTAFAIALLLPLSLRLFGSNNSLAAMPRNQFEITVFADAKDGLDLIDELVWLPERGLLAGNEANGSLLLLGSGGQSETFGSGLGSPDGMAVHEQRIYVAEEELGRISIYGWDGVRRGQIEGFESPEGLAVDTRGSLYVADLGQRLVLRVTDHGREIVASPLDGLQGPEQLAFDAEDNLYIADERARSIFRLNRSGGVEVFLDSSDGLRMPESILVHEGHLYIADNERSAIHRFDLTGNGGIYLDFERKKDLAGMAFDPDGTLYLAVTSEYRPHNRVLRVVRCGSAQC